MSRLDMTTTQYAGASDSARPRLLGPVGKTVISRLAAGIVTLIIVSVLVFAATQVLPGNAAYAVLGNTATPARLAALESQLHLNQSVPEQYWSWLRGVLHGDPGTSLASGESVSTLVFSRIANSLVLVTVAGVLSALLGLLGGIFAAARRDSWADHVLSISALSITAMPEFVVAITLTMLFSTLVFHWLPAVSVIPPGASALSDPQALVLPVATLVLVTAPYVFRMCRAAMIEALQSDYVELAVLKGIGSRRVLFIHAFLNSAAATAQVIGLNLLYLAGGIVVVEYVFNYPGIGQQLVAAVNSRDIPVIQFIVILLAAFYVFVNIATDVIALVVTPRRRFPRSG